MEYLVSDFTISCPTGLMQAARDLLADTAAEAGFESFEDTDSGLKGYVQEGLFDQAVLDAVLADFPLTETTITYVIDKAENKDWNETWEEAGFEPINIDGKIVVVDVAHKAGDVGDAKKIVIDAKLAFGTGTHETTQMIVSTLLAMELQNKRVLDCGCGTGILGIAASMLGAKDVEAYDIDEWSVENTRHNAVLNNVENISVHLGDASVIKTLHGKFDVVLANINRNILLNDMPAMVDVLADGGCLIISGFYKEDIPLLESKAKNLGLSLLTGKSKGDWQMLKFAK